MSRPQLLLAALLWAFVCPVVLAEQPDLVGELGAPERIAFTGMKTFTEQGLRDAARSNVELIVAGRAESKLDHFLYQLREGVEAGYQRRGFPEAKVQAIYDEARKAIVVSIEEGPRYQAGKIEFAGVVTEFDAQIHDCLTQWRSKKTTSYDLSKATPEKVPVTTKESTSGKSKPYWYVDHPASFYERDLRGLQWAIRDKFEQLGYYDAAFTIKLRPLANGKVDLIVSVQRLGRPAVLQQIDVSGIDKNSREDVVQFLGLSEGLKLNSEVTANVREKLRKSARFVKQEVKVVPSPENDGNATLKLALYEHPTAAPLNQPLTAIEQAAIEMAGWFEDLKDGTDDVAVTFRATSPTKTTDSTPARTYDGRIVFSPSRHEGMVTVRILQADQVVFDATLNARRRLLSFESALSKVKCELSTGESHLVANATVVAHEPARDGNVSRAMFGLGLSNVSGEASAFKTTCDPAALIGALQTEQHLKLDGNVLSFEMGEVKFRFDSKAGRLLDFSVNLKDGDNQLEFKIDVAPRLYDKAFAEHVRATTDWPIIQIDQTPVSALIAFFRGNSQPAKKGDQASVDRLPDLIQRWLKREVGIFPKPAVDHEELATKGEHFSIPVNDRAFGGLAGMYQILLPQIDEWLPNPSWLRTIARDFSFMHLGQASSERVVQGLLESNETGPLASAACAQLFGWFDAHTGSAFAVRGLNHLELHDYRQDYRPFLREDVLIGRLLKSAGTLLQDCDEQEIEQLVDLLVLDEGSQRDAVIRSLSLFRQRPIEPVLETVSHSLDELWMPIVRPRVDTLLSGVEHAWEQWISTRRKVGDQVCVKEGIEPHAGDKLVPLDQISYPATVEFIERDHIWLGNAWVRMDEVMSLDEALEDLSERLKQDPQNATRYILRGLIWEAKDEPAKALAEYEEALSVEPENVRCHLYRGLVFRKQGNLERAISDLDEAVRLADDNIEAYIHRGDCRMEQKEYDKAISDYSEAIKRNPDNVHCYCRRGNAFHWKSDFDAAIQDYTEAIQRDPKSAESYRERGRCRFAKADLDEAIQDFDSAIRMDPTNAFHFVLRATAWRALSDFDKAIEDFTEAIGLDGNDPSILIERAAVFQLNANYAESIRDYAAGLEKQPNSVPALTSLSWLLATCPQALHRDGEKAVEYATRLCDLTESKHYNPLDNLAAAYAESGDFTNAIKTINKAIELAPEEMKDDLKERRRLYRSSEPYRAREGNLDSQQHRKRLLFEQTRDNQ